jgi:hypothetical protein
MCGVVQGIDKQVLLTGCPAALHPHFCNNGCGDARNGVPRFSPLHVHTRTPPPPTHPPTSAIAVVT